MNSGANSAMRAAAGRLIARAIGRAKQPTSFIAAFFAAAILGGCGTAPSTVQDILAHKDIRYESADRQKEQALIYPPDLISRSGGGEEQVLLSEYRLEKSSGESPDAVPESTAVNIHYRRNGNIRWLELELPPGDAWRQVRGFWRDSLDFELVVEDAEVGVMETDWLELRARIPSLGFGAYLDAVLKRLHDSGERDKFLTRVERNDGGGVDVFIAHRHAVGTFDREGRFGGFESKGGDEHLEFAMLRRLMLHLAGQGADEAATIDAQIAAEDAKGDGYQLDETGLTIRQPLADSWLIVRIGLDRGGFTIEDRDFSERTFYIRHSGGPESSQIFGKANTSFFNTLFGDKAPVLRDLKLVLTDDGEGGTVVTVHSDDDETLSAKQALVILELLSENLP